MSTFTVRAESAPCKPPPFAQLPQGARHGLHGQGDRCYLADESLWLSVD